PGGRARPQGGVTLRGRLCPSDGFRQTPIHKKRLTILSEHNIAGFQVSVKHTATMRVCDGLAYVHKSSEQLAEGQGVESPSPGRRRTVKPAQRVAKVVSFDESHGIERSAVGVSPQTIHRHDARVF